MKNTNGVVAITVMSLLIVAMLIPTVIAQLQVRVMCEEGVKNETDVWLQEGDLVQLINAGPDGIKNTADDSHIADFPIGEGVPFGDINGRFYYTVGLESGTVIYCRAWNAPSYEQADYHGDSSTLNVLAAGDYNFPSWSTDTTPAQPPVPDLPALILFASGLVLVSVYFVYGRRKKKGE